jgi:transposase-like protein
MKVEEQRNVIEALSKFANINGRDKDVFAHSVLSEHRTIQQKIFGLFLKTIEEWAKQESFDLRNEHTIKTSKAIMKLFPNGTPSDEIPFI